MAIFKCDFFFIQRKFGWSETFYCDVADAPAAGAKCDAVIPVRTPLLGGDVGDEASSPYLEEVRISNVQIQRDSFVKRVPFADGVAPNPIGSADNPTLCIQANFYSGVLYRRQVYISGQPDLIISKGGVKVANVPWDNAFKAWSQTLMAQGFGILAVTKPPEVVPGQISSVTLAVPGGVQIESVVAHGLVDQSLVRIVRCPGIRGLRGNWVVKIVDATHFILLGATGTGVYVGSGEFYKRLFALKAFTGASVIGATKRSRGGPFDRPHGRHVKRVRA